MKVCLSNLATLFPALINPILLHILIQFPYISVPLYILREAFKALHCANHRFYTQYDYTIKARSFQ